MARRLDRLQEAKASLEEDFGVQVDVMVADLTDDGDLAALEARIAGKDGWGCWSTTRELDWEPARSGRSRWTAHEQMFKLHIIATMRLTHAALGNLVAGAKAA